VPLPHAAAKIADGVCPAPSMAFWTKPEAFDIRRITMLKQNLAAMSVGALIKLRDDIGTILFRKADALKAQLANFIPATDKHDSGEEALRAMLSQFMKMGRPSGVARAELERFDLRLIFSCIGYR
jgi:hypothetical protein